MRGTCLAIQCLLLTLATISAKLPSRLDILRALDLPQLRPRYQREEGGLTSTLRMLGDLSSKIFDKALRRINQWNMHPKPSYNSMDMMPAHEKNLPHNYPQDLNMAGSEHYQDTVMPSYVNPAQDWWEEPFCSECYDYTDLLKYLPSDYGDLRVTYDNGAQISQPKLVYQQVVRNHQKKSNYRRRRPTTSVPKLMTSPTNGWNPIPASLGYDYRRPTYSPLDNIKQTSNLRPVLHRPTYHKSADNVKQTSTFRPTVFSKNVMKVIKPPVNLDTKKQKTPLISLWREVDSKRIKNKTARGNSVDPTTPRPLTAPRNATKYSW